MRKFFLLFTALLLSVVSASAAKKFVPLTSDNVSEMKNGVRCLITGTTNGTTYILTSTPFNSDWYLLGKEVTVNTDGSVTPTDDALIMSMQSASTGGWLFYQIIDGETSSILLSSSTGNANRLQLLKDEEKNANTWVIETDATGTTEIKSKGNRPFMRNANYPSGDFSNYFMCVSSSYAGNYSKCQLYIETEVADDPVVEEDGTDQHPYRITSIDQVTNTSDYYLYTGELVVTYLMDGGNGGMYAQTEDGSEGINFYPWAGGIYASLNKLQVGDVVSNLMIMAYDDKVATKHRVKLFFYDNGNFDQDAEGRGVFDKLDKTITVEPKLVNLNNRPEWPINTLVKVENVTFSPNTGNFASDNYGLIQDGRLESGVASTWSNGALAATPVPTALCDLTGIVAYANMIYPRTADDIVELGDPVVEPDGTRENPYPFTSLSEIQNTSDYYIYTGESVITYSYLDKLYEITYPQFASNSTSCFYMQNDKEAAIVKTKNIVGLAGKLAEGDKVTSLIVQKDYKGDLVLFENPKAEFENALTIVDKNVAVEPVLIQLSDIANYKGYLVKLNDLTVVDPAGKTFASGQSSFLKLKQGETTSGAVLGTYVGMNDVIGKPAPMGLFNIAAALCDGQYLRITNYADIQEAAAITLSTTNLDLTEGTAPFTREVTVSGSGLKGDITIELPSSITAEPATVTKAAAEAEGGCVVTLTITPEETENYEATVTFKSEGAENAVLTITAKEVQFAPDGTLAHPYPVEKLSEIKNNTTDYSIYTGNLVVTYVDESGKSFFAQTEDNTEACRIYTNNATGLEKKLAVGDKISNMIVKVYNLGYNRFYAYPNAKGNLDAMLDRVAQNVAVTPKVVTLNNLGDRNFLVKLEKVTATNVTEGEKFTSNTSLNLKQGDVEQASVLEIFTGSSVIGNDIPQAAFDLTGIRDYTSGVYPRTMDDIYVIPVVKPTFTFYKKMPNGNYNKWSSSYTGLNGVNTRVANVYLEVINPTGDLTIECPEYVTPDKTTISKADLEAGICQIDFTIAPENAGAFEASVTLKMEDADDVTLTLSGNISMVKEVTSLADVFEQNGVFFNVKDTEVTVSYVEKVDEYDTFAYVQNEESAMRLAINSYNAPTGDKELKAGVTFKNFWVLPKKAADGSWLYNLYGNVTATTTGVSYNYEYNYEVTATDTELTPKVVKVDEIDANANRLVMLENVVFQNVAENQAFSKTQGEDLFGGTVMVATAYDVKVGEAEAKVEPFASSNVYGNNIPTQAVDVVGVAALNSTVMPRSMADFTDAVAPAEPKAEVTLESSVDKIAINEKTLVATYKVEVENLTADGTVTFTGENADMFVAEPATITNETTEVKVYATATAAGEYAAKVVFNFGIEALNKEFDLAVEAAAAVTPEVPTVTLSNAVVKLSAIEGQEATDKVTLTMANCTAPVVITAKNEVNEITLSTMSIEPSAEPVEITITFAPTKEGVFKQQFEITTEGMETPVVLEVEGTGISYIAMLAADADGIYRVYNVNGVKLMETSNAQDLNNLAAGLYIINGRKYMVRK